MFPIIVWSVLWHCPSVFICKLSVGPITHIKAWSHLKTQPSLHPVHVSLSLGSIFIVCCVPWRCAVFSWQWKSSNRYPEVGHPCCLQSAPSLLLSPGIFYLLLPWGVAFLDTDDSGKAKLIITLLTVLWLPAPVLLYWLHHCWRGLEDNRKCCFQPCCGRVEKGEQDAGLVFLHRIGKVLQELGQGLMYNSRGFSRGF